MISLFEHLTRPTDLTYKELRRMLMRRKILGEDVDDLLYNLDYITHLVENFDYYATLYGAPRVYGEIFSFFKPKVRASRLSVLAEEFRYDRTVLDELFDELLSVKKELIRENAPHELVRVVNTILSSLGQKPEEIYRQIKHFLALYDVWKELGDEAKDYLAVDTFAPQAPSGVTDTEKAKVVKFVLDQIRRMQRVTSTDIRRFVGNANLAKQLLDACKKEGLLSYDSTSRSWVVTKKGIDFVGMSELVDPGSLVENLRSGGAFE